MKSYTLQRLSVLLAAAIIITSGVRGQYMAPMKQWGMELNHTFNAAAWKYSTDWALEVLQSKDCFYYSCGFGSRELQNQYGVSCLVKGAYRPSIFKVSGGGSTVLWKNIYDAGKPNYPGRLIDIIEIPGNEFVAIGDKAVKIVDDPNPINIQILKCEIFIVRVDKDGNLLKQAFVTLPHATSEVGQSIRRLTNGHYIITGRSDGGDVRLGGYDIYLAELDEDFKLLWHKNFGTTGHERGFTVRPAWSGGVSPDGTPSGTHDGYFLTGYIYNQANNDGDIWVMKTDLSGNPVSGWPLIIDSRSISGYSFSPESSCTSSTPSHHDEGYGLEQIHDGNIVISARVNFFHLQCDPGNPDQPVCQVGGADFFEFLSSDVLFLKVNGNSGALSWITKVTHMSGSDFTPKIKETYDHGLVTSGTTANNSGPEQAMHEADLVVVKTDGSGNKLWRKIFRGPGDRNCGFGLYVTRDGGYVVSGNNYNHADNYIVAKLSNDCQVSNYTMPAEHTQLMTVNRNWNTSRDVVGTIVVENGATLTIDGGAIIRFGSYKNMYDEYNPDADAPNILPYVHQHVGIVVKPGGQLIVDNATLTGISCIDGVDGLWDGIIVEGTPGASIIQNPAAFGKVIIRNNAVIENARGAVVVGTYPSSPGGILIATNSTFRNNRSGITYFPYTDPNYPHLNPGSINNCNFICDAPVPEYSGLGIQSFVSYWGTRGTRIYGSNFINTVGAGIFADGYRGRAINSEDADYFITRTMDIHGNLGPQNVFEGLTTGIDAKAVGNPSCRAKISGCLFMNVQEGVNFKGSQGGDEVTCSYFEVNSGFIETPGRNFDYYYPTYPGAPYTYGIYTAGAGNFKLARNDFHFYNSAVVGFGTVTDNSGDGGGEIKMNTLTDHTPLTHYAMEALGNNPALSITCNTYVDMKQDWYVHNFSSLTGSGAHTFATQSASLKAPGNVFSNNGPTGHIQNHEIQVIYFEENSGEPFNLWGAPNPTSIVAGPHPVVDCKHDCFGISDEGDEDGGGGGAVNPVSPPDIEPPIEEDVPQAAELMLELNAGNKPFNKLDAEELDKLRIIATTPGKYAIYARNLISMNTGEEFLTKPLLSDKPAAPASPVAPKNSAATNHALSLYPNPANGPVQVVYELPEGHDKGEVVLINMLGEQLSSVPVTSAGKETSIDTGSLPAGVYLVKLSAGGQMIGSEKLVIIR